MNTIAKLFARVSLASAALLIPHTQGESPQTKQPSPAARLRAEASRSRPSPAQLQGDGSLFEELLRAQQATDWLLVDPRPLASLTGPGQATPLLHTEFRLAAISRQNGDACSDRAPPQAARSPELPETAKRACLIDLPAADGPKRDAALRHPSAGIALPQTEVPELSPYLLATTGPQPPAEPRRERTAHEPPPPAPPVAIDDAPGFDPELQLVLDHLPKPGAPDREPASVRLLIRYAAGTVCLWALGAVTRRPERTAPTRRSLRGAWA